MSTESYFFTVRLEDQSSNLLTQHFDLLQRAIATTQAKLPFEIVAATVLPNRFHAVLTLPADDADYGKRIKMIKKTFSRQLPPAVRMQATRNGKWLWQRRFWEQRVESATEMQEYLTLIGEAPTREGLVKRAANWRYRTDAILPPVARAS